MENDVMTQPDLVSKLREALQAARRFVRGRHSTLTYGPQALLEQIDEAIALLGLASTPIVPGTAGLSADFFLEHETQYTQHKEFWVWECSCGAIEEEKFISHEECHVQTRRHWADRLNALLVTKPAEPRGLERELAESRSEFAVLSRACGNWREWPAGTVSKDVPDYTHDDWKAAARAILERNKLREREAQIRKSVLEEAAQLLKYCGYSANLVDEIRSLAERPAPAGEAIRCVNCQVVRPRSQDRCNCGFYYATPVAGEVKGEK